MKRFVVVVVFDTIDNDEEILILFADGEDSKAALRAALIQEECMKIITDGYYLKSWHIRELLK